MIMIGLKPSYELSALAIYITAHVGACQEQAEISACFTMIHTASIPVIFPCT